MIMMAFDDDIEQFGKSFVCKPISIVLQVGVKHQKPYLQDEQMENLKNMMRIFGSDHFADQRLLDYIKFLINLPITITLSLSPSTTSYPSNQIPISRILIIKFQLMPNLKIERQRFFELMGERLQFQWLDNLGFQFGIEIQEDQERDKDGKIVKEYFKFDCMNNRPDLLSEASLVRAFKIYLGKAEIPRVVLTQPTTSITIDPSVKQIRPFIAAAILRNVTFNEKTYKAFIAAQEKLHDTFCRARKYASIGTHDLDTIQGPFKYVAKDPKDFEFVPLNQEAKVNGLGMMELLENHKLKEYLHLIRDSPVYPLVLDANDVVCSVPPIINGERSKISINTKNVLVEVTALNRPKAFICLNNIIWSFSEYCEVPFQVEPVEIINGEERFLTPNVDPREFIVQHKKAETLIGAKLNPEDVVGYLKRTGLTATIAEQGTYKVEAPFWRGDVLHECDVLEDIAICYGYTKIVPAMPPSTTIGGRLRINKFTDFLRHEMAQAQFNEVQNFALCSKADVTTNIFSEDQSKLIKIENAKTKEFQTGRTTLLSGLLRTIYENKSNPLPYKLFQAGDCIVVDNSTDTGAKNLRKLAAVITDEILQGSKKGIFSIVHGALDLILKKSNLTFEKDYKLIPTQNPFYFPGQQFDILLHGQILGNLGVVHPRVLSKFQWQHPTAMWELDINILQKHYTNSYN